MEEVNTQLQEAPQETSQEATQSVYTDNTPDINLQKLREAKEAADRRARQLEEDNQKLLQYMKQQQQQQQPQQSSDDDEDLVDKRQLNEVNKRLDETTKSMQSMYQQNEEMVAELKLNSEFQDFNSIVSDANIKSYLEKNPEMRGAFVNNDSLYNRGKAAYKLIKQHMDSNNKSKEYEKAKQQVGQHVDTNMNKPMPTSAINRQQGTNPIDQANLFSGGYTDELGDKLRAEMDAAIARKR